MSTGITLHLPASPGGLLPYYIAVDRPRRSVVVGIRGSLSLNDVVTDLLCEPVPFDVPGVDPNVGAGWRRGGSGHGRMGQDGVG